MKKVIWLGDTRKVARGLPLTTKHALGTQLILVQQGLDPADWKPMKSIGPGVKEIRIRAGGAYRVIYMANIGNAVYVLHVFQKKTQKTAKPDIELAKQRLVELRREIQ